MKITILGILHQSQLLHLSHRLSFRQEVNLEDNEAGAATLSLGSLLSDTRQSKLRPGIGSGNEFFSRKSL